MKLREPNGDDCIMDTCLHESAHAFISELTYHPVGILTIENEMFFLNDDNLDTKYGTCCGQLIHDNKYGTAFHNIFDDYDIRIVNKWLENEVMVNVAGAAMTGIINANSTLAELIDNGGENDLEDIKHMPISKVLEGIDNVEKILKKPVVSKTIYELAYVLENYGSLTGEEVRSIIRSNISEKRLNQLREKYVKLYPDGFDFIFYNVDVYNLEYTWYGDYKLMEESSELGERHIVGVYNYEE
jgi:hypothetical protein